MLHLPVLLQNQNPGDLVLGRLWRFPISPLVRVTASARTAHMYVIGMSGKGKSKLLEWCLYQDIAAGRGCGLIDPHSLLADDLLRLLITRNVLADPNIHQQLIYVDPARRTTSSPSTSWPRRLNTPTTSPPQYWKPSAAPGRNA